MTTTIRDTTAHTEQSPTTQHGHLLLQGPLGLERVSWQQADEASVHTADKVFAQLRQEGYRAYRKQPGAAVHEEITTFDPQAEEIILIQALVGGAV